VNVVVSKSWQFQAAHSNPYHAGACKNVHGHTYTVRAWARRSDGGVQEYGHESGMVIDTRKLSAAWREIHERIDHTDLNESTPCDPTTIEMLAGWIMEQFQLRGCPEVYRVRVYEGSTAYAEASDDE